jgi:hypothetical protein
MKEFPLNCSSRELVGLFLFLRTREDELDAELEALHERLSELLYQHLSIEEMERLSELYSQKIDVLNQKG